MKSQGKSLFPRSMEAITALSDEQRGYLDRVWRESLSLEHCRWIDCFDFHLWFDSKELALELLNSIGGSFIQDGDWGSSGNKAYSLTLLGILACPSFKGKLTSVILILEHIRSIAQSSEYPITIPDEEMCTIASITGSDLDEIAQFFYKSHQISSLIHRSNRQWQVKKGEIVTDLRSAKSASEFIDSMAMNDFSIGKPVHKADRDRQYLSTASVDKTELLFLIIRYLSLDKALHSRAEHSVRRLIFFLRVVVSGIIGLIMHIILNNIFYSFIGIGVAFFLIGMFPSLEKHLGSRINQIECKLASKRFKKALKQAHVRFLSDREICIESVSNQVEVLSKNSIFPPCYNEQDLFEADIDYLTTPQYREH